MIDTGPAAAFLQEYAVRASEPLHPFWVVMDTVGYLPPPGKPLMFRRPDQVERLDDWLDEVVRLT